MYGRLKTRILDRVKSELAKLLDVSDSTLEFLQHLNRFWLDHCDEMNNIRGLFLYMDRAFIMRYPNMLPLWDLGLEIFCNEVMNNTHIRKRCVDGVLRMIESERSGAQVCYNCFEQLIFPCAFTLSYEYKPVVSASRLQHIPNEVL
ncbi:unnamed protein product [Gongylonema pulchrum]|uniref:Cullin domain-containing protein n=1 Tax=Gongylonema pulchrum TaxID=637853 RepID=A0A183ELI8_9BILA|nr:unnamed protein product [Gongylonema pulchrum]